MLCDFFNFLWRGVSLLTVSVVIHCINYWGRGGTKWPQWAHKLWRASLLGRLKTDFMFYIRSCLCFSTINGKKLHNIFSGYFRRCAIYNKEQLCQVFPGYLLSPYWSPYWICTHHPTCQWSLTSIYTKGHTSNPWNKCPKRGLLTMDGQILIEKHYHSLKTKIMYQRSLIITRCLTLYYLSYMLFWEISVVYQNPLYI